MLFEVGEEAILECRRMYVKTLLQEGGGITDFIRKCVVVSLIHCELISQMRLLKQSCKYSG